MASAIASSTICLSIDFSRATASAICSSSSLLALTTIFFLQSRLPDHDRPAAQSRFRFGFIARVLRQVFVRLATVFLRFLARPVILGQGVADEIVGQDKMCLGDGVEGHA